jgi:hypothetical protein
MSAASSAVSSIGISGEMKGPRKHQHKVAYLQHWSLFILIHELEKKSAGARIQSNA